MSLVVLYSGVSFIRHSTVYHCHNCVYTVHIHVFFYYSNSSLLFQIVCDRSEVYALGCAVARAYPRYQKSSAMFAMVVQEITISFLLQGDNVDPLKDELQCLKKSAEGKPNMLL